MAIPRGDPCSCRHRAIADDSTCSTLALGRNRVSDSHHSGPIDAQRRDESVIRYASAMDAWESLVPADSALQLWPVASST